MTDADRYHIPPQPPVNATNVLDLKPLLSWFRDMLSEARTAAADARCEARGHREEVVKLEARLGEMTAKADDWRKECGAIVGKLEKMEGQRDEARTVLKRIERAWCIEGDYAYDPSIPGEDEKHPIERRLEGMAAMHTADVERLKTQLEFARCDAKDAQQMLMDERKRTQVPRVELVPASAAAIKEAARLVTGAVPQVCNAGYEYNVGPWWGLSIGPCNTEAGNAARLALCKLLEELEPAATVKP